MDAAKGLLVLIVAAALWNPSEAFGQSGWSGGTTPSSAQTMYDRYGQPIAQRTQTAVSETSNSVRDGFDAGVRAAEQSINSSWSGQPASATSAPAWPTTPVTAPAAPTWPTNQPSAAVAPTRAAAPIAVNGGWSSIGTGIAAPPLLVPNSPMAAPAPASVISSFNQPSYTSVASNDATPLHSVLKDPSTPAAPAASSTTAGAPTDWSAGWSGDNNTANPASVNRQGTAPLQGAAGTTANDPRYNSSTQAGNSWSGSDSWSQNQPPTLSAANGAASVNRPNTTTNPSSSFSGSNPQNGQVTLPAIPQFTGQQAGQGTTASSPAIGNFGSYSSPGTMATSPTGMPNQMQPGLNQFGQLQTGKSPMETPWMPLIASVLTLAGSLAANLYLGVSYLDARQKYQSLVRKTAETFRRVKAVAA